MRKIKPTTHRLTHRFSFSINLRRGAVGIVTETLGESRATEGLLGLCKLGNIVRQVPRLMIVAIGGLRPEGKGGTSSDDSMVGSVSMVKDSEMTLGKSTPGKFRSNEVEECIGGI